MFHYHFSKELPCIKYYLIFKSITSNININISQISIILHFKVSPQRVNREGVLSPGDGDAHRISLKSQEKEIWPQDNQSYEIGIQNSFDIVIFCGLSNILKLII